MISRKTTSNILFFVGAGCVVFGLFGCEALSPEVVESGTNVVESVGETATALGAASGNPILLGAGVILTSVATWLRMKNSPTPTS